MNRIPAKSTFRFFVRAEIRALDYFDHYFTCERSFPERALMFSLRRNHRPDSSIVALDVDRFRYVLAYILHRTPKPSPQLSARRHSVKVWTQLGLPAFLTYNFTSLYSRNCRAIPFLEMSARRPLR